MTRIFDLGPGIRLVWLAGELPVLVTEVDEATATRLLEAASPSCLAELPGEPARILHLVCGLEGGP